MTSQFIHRRALAALTALTALGGAHAQIAAPAAAASAPTAPEAVQKVEITSVRDPSTEQRRQSTAAKIVIGREEIDKFGDRTLGEVLRRLPGVSTPGAPGRGGAPRMRGLGNGYTQILVDGQRAPAGFSLESLTPDQVERIEILRAPSAETGAQAIAGTINIITREGYRKRLNEIRLGAAYENGETGPNLSWTHNDSAGDFIYNLSTSLYDSRRASSSQTDTLRSTLDSGEVTLAQHESTQALDKRSGLNLSSRLQWRLGTGGDSLVLTPTLYHSEGRIDRNSTLTQSVAVPPAASLYDTAVSATDSRFTNAAINGQWRKRLGAGPLAELSGGVGSWDSSSDTRRNEFRADVEAPLRTLDERTGQRERYARLNAKLTSLVGGNAGAADASAAPGGEHSLVGGVEVEGVRRTETRASTGSSAIDGADSNDNLQASRLRLAAYLQDEWNPSPNWSANAGLRWEGITTHGESDDGSRPTNRGSVLTPLLHAVWRPDPKSRDQVRFSLTRSYRAPNLGALIAQRTINARYPADGPNTPIYPDRVGNPELKSELATGIDIAFERYLTGGGVLSANLFQRRISDLMRSVTSLQTVAWSPVQRWVTQMQNIGGASTRGVELEAKFRLDQVLDGAPAVELRNNLSLYHSQVDTVPGPDNRLDQQAWASANIGGDYRLRSLPLSLGGSFNWVPGYRTQESDTQVVTAGAKRIFDAYALWTFSPGVALRLLASNLAAEDYLSSNQIDSPTANTRDTASTTSASYINWQLRLELKM